LGQVQPQSNTTQPHRAMFSYPSRTPHAVPSKQAQFGLRPPSLSQSPARCNLSKIRLGPSPAEANMFSSCNNLRAALSAAPMWMAAHS
jgi:hypothetical protein